MIEVENLTKTFKIIKKEKGLKGTIKSLFNRKIDHINAVNNINFTINKGEIIGYIGANGAGKSTTIKMMSGILTPSEGRITVDGRIPYLQRTENAKNIGVVFGQKTQLWWDLPLGETFAILKEIYQVPDDIYTEQMIYFDEIFQLSDFMQQTVRTLSLGQRMRADLAASMLHNPKVLYLDEPTIGLDVMVKERIRKAIKDLNKKYGTTIILTTHDMSDIEELCHRIIIIDKGQLIYDGALENIRKDFGYERTLLFDLRFEDDELAIIHKNLPQIYNAIPLSTESNLKITLINQQLKIQFNRNELNIADIMNFVLKSYNVLDFTIQDMDVEAIVKQFDTTL
ncbi:ABC transporter ATP-binding protein [Fusibacter bizertensis]